LSCDEEDGDEEKVDMEEEVDAEEEIEARIEGGGSGGISSSRTTTAGATFTAEDGGEKIDDEEETEVEENGALRSLVGIGTPSAFASSGCTVCQWFLRASGPVDDLYSTAHRLHFFRPSAVGVKQRAVMRKRAGPDMGLEWEREGERGLCDAQ
jgi:hypothetical protein